MLLKGFSTVFIQILMFEIISTNAQLPLKQYLQLAGLTSASPDITTLRTLGIPSRQSINTNPILSTGSALSSIPLSSLQLPPSVIKASSNPSNVQTNAGLDSTVLNNLAIALQLLILSNLMNIPPPDSEKENEFEETFDCGIPAHIPFTPPTNVKSYPAPTQPKKSMAYSQEPNIAYNQEKVLYYIEPRPQGIAYSQTQTYEPNFSPNANFVGSSGFVESSVLGSYMPKTRPNPRSSMTLMSPYEALSPNSPFSDPILCSSYGSAIGTKNDFQSPYSAILDGQDSFSMSDFF